MGPPPQVGFPLLGPLWALFFWSKFPVFHFLKVTHFFIFIFSVSMAVIKWGHLENSVSQMPGEHKNSEILRQVTDGSWCYPIIYLQCFPEWDSQVQIFDSNLRKVDLNLSFVAGSLQLRLRHVILFWNAELGFTSLPAVCTI